MSKNVYLTRGRDEICIGSVSQFIGGPIQKEENGVNGPGMSLAAAVSDIVSDLVFSVPNQTEASFTIKVR